VSRSLDQVPKSDGQGRSQSSGRLRPGQLWQSLPPALFYTMLLPHFVRLCWRYKASPALIASANPKWPFGGLPLAPKDELLRRFDAAQVLPFISLTTASPLDQRQAAAQRFAAEHGWPLALKPLTGHSGLDVHCVSSVEALDLLLAQQSWDYMLQAWDENPVEYGVFWVKIPGSERGQVVSLTEKVVPVLCGDGKRSLRQLIADCDTDNPLALQAQWAGELDRVWPAGRVEPALRVAAHSRGARCVDRGDCVGPALSAHMEKLCLDAGMWFGRLDVKAADQAAFLQGDFRIIEANGCTAEFIHIWDREHSLDYGIAELKRQYEVLFAVADGHRKKGAKTLSMASLAFNYTRFFWRSKRASGRFW
jgi:hypothetical protein